MGLPPFPRIGYEIGPQLPAAHASHFGVTFSSSRSAIAMHRRHSRLTRVQRQEGVSVSSGSRSAVCSAKVSFDTSAFCSSSIEPNSAGLPSLSHSSGGGTGFAVRATGALRPVGLGAAFLGGEERRTGGAEQSIVNSS